MIYAMIFYSSMMTSTLMNQRHPRKLELILQENLPLYHMSSLPSLKNIHEKINHFYCQRNVLNPMTSGEDLHSSICEELEILSIMYVHRNWQKGGSAMTKCGCVTVFHDPNIHFVSANWLCSSFKRKKEDEDQGIVTWYCYALLQCNGNKYKFTIPFCNVIEPIVELTED